MKHWTEKGYVHELSKKNGTRHVVEMSTSREDVQKGTRIASQHAVNVGKGTSEGNKPN